MLINLAIGLPTTLVCLILQVAVTFLSRRARERERILSYCEFATDTLLAAVRANGKLKAGVERSVNMEKTHE